MEMMGTLEDISISMTVQKIYIFISDAEVLSTLIYIFIWSLLSLDTFFFFGWILLIGPGQDKD